MRKKYLRKVKSSLKSLHKLVVVVNFACLAIRKVLESLFLGSQALFRIFLPLSPGGKHQREESLPKAETSSDSNPPGS
jgi:hypothetical protein